MGLFAFDRQVLRHYHAIALTMAAVNLFEAAGLVSLTVDALAWFNLAGALAMGFAWPLHEAIVQRRAERQERQDRGGNGRLVPES